MADLLSDPKVAGIFSALTNATRSAEDPIDLGDIERAAALAESIGDPVAMWHNHNALARRIDAKNRRGYLCVNPEILTPAQAQQIHGSVVEREGVQFRVLVDEIMVGMRTPGTGEIAAGYTIAHDSDLWRAYHAALEHVVDHG